MIGGLGFFFLLFFEKSCYPSICLRYSGMLYSKSTHLFINFYFLWN